MDWSQNKAWLILNDMKKFEIVKLEKDQLEFIKAKYLMNPDEN